MDVSSIIFIVLMFVVFYVFLILPQKKHMKERQAMLDGIKAGDEVETVGRIYGRVIAVNEDIITIEVGVGNSVQIRISKEGVGRVIQDKK